MCFDIFDRRMCTYQVQRHTDTQTHVLCHLIKFVGKCWSASNAHCFTTNGRLHAKHLDRTFNNSIQVIYVYIGWILHWIALHCIVCGEHGRMFTDIKYVVIKCNCMRCMHEICVIEACNKRFANHSNSCICILSFYHCWCLYQITLAAGMRLLIWGQKAGKMKCDDSEHLAARDHNWNTIWKPFIKHRINSWKYANAFLCANWMIEMEEMVFLFWHKELASGHTISLRADIYAKYLDRTQQWCARSLVHI